LCSFIDLASVKETTDNAAIFENARDTYKLITNRFLPTVKKWIQVITKASGKYINLNIFNFVYIEKEIGMGKECSIYGQMTNANKILVTKPEWKRLLGTPKHMWEA
jgi:hypothetical protein